jgi:hypothetical protein
MLDVVYFVLAALPLLGGLALVLLAVRERMQASAAPVKAADRNFPR